MGRRRIMAVVVMSWVGTALDIAYAFGAPAGCIRYTRRSRRSTAMATRARVEDAPGRPAQSAVRPASLHDDGAHHVRMDLTVVGEPSRRCERKVESAARRDVPRGPLASVCRGRVCGVVVVDPADRRADRYGQWVLAKRVRRLSRRAVRNAHGRASTRCGRWRGHRGGWRTIAAAAGSAAHRDGEN